MPSHFITLTEAKALTSNFKKSKHKLLEPNLKDKDVLPVCETFSREAFDIVLAKPGCKGLRMYFAMDNANMVKLIIVGVNEKNEDMINLAGEGKDDETDDIIDQGTRCPANCPPPSPLNG
jgi:hypothetical protein